MRAPLRRPVAVLFQPVVARRDRNRRRPGDGAARLAWQLAWRVGHGAGAL